MKLIGMLDSPYVRRVASSAKRLGIAWNGGASLYQPNTSLELGTAHLRHELDKHGGLPYLAVGAYNAGPAPVTIWLFSVITSPSG